MNLYLALLRGINVGGKNILPMKKLVVLMEGLGCENVKTYIQSGNVIFRHSGIEGGQLAEDIGSKIFEKFGFTPRIMLMDASEFQQAINANPFDTEGGKAVSFFFLESIPKAPAMDLLEKRRTGSEQFKLHQKVFYLYAPDGVGRSKLAGQAERLLGVAVTARNWNTVSKLAAMLEC